MHVLFKLPHCVQNPSVPSSSPGNMSTFPPAVQLKVVTLAAYPSVQLTSHKPFCGMSDCTSITKGLQGGVKVVELIGGYVALKGGVTEKLAGRVVVRLTGGVPVKFTGGVAVKFHWGVVKFPGGGVV